LSRAVGEDEGIRDQELSREVPDAFLSSLQLADGKREGEIPDALLSSPQLAHSGREWKDRSPMKAFRHIFIHFPELKGTNYAEEAQIDSKILSLFGTDRVLSFPSVHAASKQLLCLRRVDGKKSHSPFCCIMLARFNPGKFSHGFPLA
jgi:hypothetical protein